jgi:AcrR family transcriptional regulator
VEGERVDFAAFCLQEACSQFATPTPLSNSTVSSSAITDPRVRRNRTALREALLELLQTKSLEQITLRDIAAAAGVGYRTYFRHYPSKEALLDDVAAEEIAQLFELALPVYDAVDSRANCLILCSYVEQHRPLWSALLLGGAAGAVREELLRRGRVASVERAQKGWMPAELANALAVSAMIELLTWWLRQADPLPVERIAEILDRIAIAPAEIAPTTHRPPASGG